VNDSFQDFGSQWQQRDRAIVGNRGGITGLEDWLFLYFRDSREWWFLILDSCMVS